MTDCENFPFQVDFNTLVKLLVVVFVTSSLYSYTVVVLTKESSYTPRKPYVSEEASAVWEGAFEDKRRICCKTHVKSAHKESQIRVPNVRCSYSSSSETARAVLQQQQDRRLQRRAKLGMHAYRCRRCRRRRRRRSG